MSNQPEAGKTDRSRDVFILLALFFGGAVLRWAAASFRGQYLCFDESMYILLGRNLLSGNGYTLNDLPNATFPFLISIIAGIGDLCVGPRWALSLPSALLGAAAVLPLYLLAGKMASRKVAVAAGILFVGFPALLLFSPFMSYARRLYEGSEQIHLFFALWMAYFAYSAALEGRWRDLVLGGICGGAAFQVRQEGGAIAAALFAWLILAALLQRRYRRSLRALAFAAAIIVSACPFVFHVGRVTGTYGPGLRLAGSVPMRTAFVPVIERNEWDAALSALFALNEEGTQLQTPYYGVSHWHRERFRRGVEAFGPFEALRGLRPASVTEGLRIFVDRVIPDRLRLAVLMGFAAVLFSQRRWLNIGFLAALFAPAAVVAMMIFPLARFWMFLAPFAVLLIGWGIMFLFSLPALLQPRADRWLTAVGLVAITALSLLGARDSLRAQRRYRAESRNFERVVEVLQEQAAVWLRDNTPPDARVMASSPQAVVMADRLWLALPVTDDKRLLDYALLKRADFVMKTVTRRPEKSAGFERALAKVFEGDSYGYYVALYVYDLARLRDESRDAPQP